MTETKTPDVPGETYDLIAAMVDANARSLAWTNDRLHEYEQKQTRDMALALVKFYEGVERSREVLSTPALDRACAVVQGVLDTAYRILDEASA